MSENPTSDDERRNQRELYLMLNSGKDWEFWPTEINGVTVVKVPKTKTRPAKLMIGINPIKDNREIRRKPLFVDQVSFLLFKELFNAEKISKLVEKVKVSNEQYYDAVTEKKNIYKII